MRKSISLVAALALSSSVAFAGYGSNAGYSSTKKINIENQQWVLIGYPGGGAVSSGSAGTVAAQDSISSSSNNDGDIGYPENWNYANADGAAIEVNSTMDTAWGTESNATFKIAAKSGYWSQLLAHSNYSTNNVGEPAVVFTQSSNFMNIPMAVANGAFADAMEIKLDGTDTTTDAILTLTFNPRFNNETFTLYLDANDSNNTSYTLTAQSGGTAYILNDPSSSTSRPTTNQLIEFNTTYGGNGAIVDNNISFGVSGLNTYLGRTQTISKDANYTVAKFNSAGQSWMTYEANLTGGTVISDGGLMDSSDNINRVEKGGAYWYRLNTGNSVKDDYNMSITVQDEDVGVNDLSIVTDSWNLLALPKGHIKHSQGGMIVPKSSTTYINFKGTVGDIEDVATNSILLESAKSINGFIDANGTLFEVPIRAYPMVTAGDILIVADTQVDFNLSTGKIASSIGGVKIGNSGKTKLGESAIAIKMNEGFFDRVGAGTFTIEIPDLFSGFTGVDVNLSGIATTGAAVAANLISLQSNIETAMYNQACLHTNGGDYNITTFDSDFSGVDDSFLIALAAKGERNITADNSNPTTCTTNGITRGSYNDKYLRIGIRENTYVTPYINKKDGNSSALHIVDTSGNVYAKGIISTDSTPTITIADAGYGTSTILYNEGNLTNSSNNHLDWNLTTGANADSNYTYFVTSSRTLMLAESNVTEYNLTGASKYSILSQTNKNDVLIDALYLSSSDRTGSTWITDSADVNSTFLKGIITNVFTLADLAQAPLNSNGDLTGASEGLAGYSSSIDLNINTVWSVDMPTSGPLYDIITATTGNTVPSRILTYRNGAYVSIDFSKTANTSEWFDSEDLYFMSAFNGYWVKTDSLMGTYDVDLPSSTDSTENVFRTTYDMVSGTTTNYIFSKWIINNVATTVNGSASSVFGTSMHNISVGDSNMSAQYTSVIDGVDRYEILIDPYTFPDFGEEGFATGTTKSIVVTNGFTSTASNGNTPPTINNADSLTFTKPSAPSVTGTNNNDLTITAPADGTIEVHLSYIDEANLSFTKLFSSTDGAVSISPQDLNVTATFTTSNGIVGTDINETKIRIFNLANNGLSSDVTTVIYPLFNTLLINPSVVNGSSDDYNLSVATYLDLNQTEWIDADGDGTGSQEAQVVYNILTDDGSDNEANAVPARYDINGTLIAIPTTGHPTFTGGSAVDGVQILSSQTGSIPVTLSYRPNGVTTSSMGGSTNRNMDIYDGTTLVAKLGFLDSPQTGYDYNGTKWYLNTTISGVNKMYVGIFETNATNSAATTTVNCAYVSTNCNTLTTTRTISE